MKQNPVCDGLSVEFSADIEILVLVNSLKGEFRSGQISIAQSGAIFE